MSLSPLLRVLLPTLLILSLVLQACGFRLRGAVDMPPELQTTVAEGVAAYSSLGEALSRSWRQSDARLEFDRELQGDAARLIITREELSRRTLSIDSAGRPNEYELRYQVAFNLQDAAGRSLLENQSINVTRAYQFNPDNALAMDDEEARLEKILAEDAALQMLRRITFQLRNRATTTPAEDALPVTPQVDGPDERDDETAR